MFACKAVEVPASGGKRTWHGFYRVDGESNWHIARSSYGPICYESEAYALAGARVSAENDAK